jgi:hypothetical protein
VVARRLAATECPFIISDMLSKHSKLFDKYARAHGHLTGTQGFFHSLCGALR